MEPLCCNKRLPYSEKEGNLGREHYRYEFITWKWWDSLFLRELNMEKIVKRWINLSLHIYFSTSFLLSNLKKAFSGEILTCGLDPEHYQPFLGSIWFKLSSLSSLSYPLYFPRPCAACHLHLCCLHFHVYHTPSSSQYFFLVHGTKICWASTVFQAMY